MVRVKGRGQRVWAGDTMKIIKRGNNLRVVRYEKGEMVNPYRDTWGTGHAPDQVTIDRVINLGADRYGGKETVNHLRPLMPADDFLYTIEIWTEPEVNEFGEVTP